jgi:hypothetical protein
LAIVLFCIYLPTRACEIAFRLTFKNAVFSFGLDKPETRRPLAEMVLDRSLGFTLERLALVPFVIVFSLTGTKGDRHKRGTWKIVPHVPTLRFSPALVLMAWLRRVADEAGVDTIDVDKDFVFPAASGRRLSFRPCVGPRAVSVLLSGVASKYAGIEHAGASAWRAQSATWLRKNGMSLEQIALAGGWFKTDTILHNYLQGTTPDDDFLESLFN